jgi:hypothetical protein
MKRLFLSLVIVGMFASGLTYAKSGGSHSSGGTTHVNGYTRKDGTYVHGYDRHTGGSSTGSSSDSSSGSSSPGSSSSSAYKSRLTTINHAHYASGYVGARDSDGRIIRSESAKREFMRMTGYPHGRPGYVVDHVTALKRGGADAPSNMQWQTIAEAKAKDKWE